MSDSTADDEQTYDRVNIGSPNLPPGLTQRQAEKMQGIDVDQTVLSQEELREQRAAAERRLRAAEADADCCSAPKLIELPSRRQDPQSDGHQATSYECTACGETHS